MSFVKVARSLAGVLTVALGILPIAPPEHVHEGEEQGHHHVVIHRHVQAHGLVETAAAHQASVDDHDGPVLTLTAVYTVPAQHVVGGELQPVGDVLEPPISELRQRPSPDVDILIHSPPRAPTSLRAPPFFSAS